MWISFSQIFTYISRERLTWTIFAQIDRLVNALQLCSWQYSHKKLCSRLSSIEVHFLTENDHFALGATYTVHFSLIIKIAVDFLLVTIELFSLGVTAEALRMNIDWKSASFAPTGSVWPKFQVEGVAHTNHSSCLKTMVKDISCGIRMLAHISLFLSEITRLTDGQTHRKASVIQCVALHAVAR